MRGRAEGCAGSEERGLVRVCTGVPRLPGPVDMTVARDTRAGTLTHTCINVYFASMCDSVRARGVHLCTCMRVRTHKTTIPRRDAVCVFIYMEKVDHFYRRMPHPRRRTF